LLYFKDTNQSNNADDSPLEEIHGMTIYLNKLIENINDDKLKSIEQSFLEKGKKGKLNEAQLHDVMTSQGIILSNEDFKPMFNKIDVTKQDTVDFLQFMVYLSFEFELKRTRYDLSEEKLSKLSLKLLPDQLAEDENGRRLNIVDIAFKPMINQHQQTILKDSEYVTITSKGELGFFSSDLKWKNTFLILNSPEVMLRIL